MEKQHRISFRRDENFTLESCLLPLQQHEDKKEIDLSAIVERLTDAPLEPSLFAKYLHHQLNLLARRLKLRFECPGIGAQYTLARPDAAFAFRILLDALKGSVCQVEVCQGDKSIACPHLVNKLNSYSFDELIEQINSLNEYCDQPFEGNLRRQMPVLVQSLETDIDSLCSPVADSESPVSINSCQIGRLWHRGCSLLVGRPQRLLLYRLASQHQPQQQRQPAAPPSELTATVGVAHTSVPYSLPVIPIVTVTRTGPGDHSSPRFSQLTQDSSCPVRATYCLRLDRPLPISLDQLDRLQAVTGVPVPMPVPVPAQQEDPQPPPASLLALIGDLLDQPDLSTETPLRVNLSHQLVSLRCSLRGQVIQYVPFSSPAVLSQLSVLLRQQFVLNQLLASCLQLTPNRANLEPGVTCFEFEVVSPTDFRLSIMRGLTIKKHLYALDLNTSDCSPACRRLKTSAAEPGACSPADAGPAAPSAQFLERALRTGGLSLPLAIRRLQSLRGRRGRQQQQLCRRGPFGSARQMSSADAAAPQSLRRVASASALAAIASGLVEVKGVAAPAPLSASSVAARPRFCLEAPAPRPKRHPLGPPVPIEFQPPAPPPMPPHGAAFGHHPLHQQAFGAGQFSQFGRQLSHPAGADGGGHHHPMPPHHYAQFQPPHGYPAGPQQHQLYQQQQLVGGQATPPHLYRQGPPHLSGYHQRMPHGYPPHSQTPPYGVQQFRPGGQPYYPGPGHQPHPPPPPSQQQQQQQSQQPQQQQQPHHSPYHPPSYVQMPPASPHHPMLGSPAPQQPHTPQPHTPQPLHHPSTPVASSMEIGGPGTPLEQQLMGHHLADSGGSGSGFPPLTPADKSNQNPVLISLLQDDSTNCGGAVVAQQMPMPHPGQQPQPQQHRQMFPHGAAPPGYGQQQPQHQPQVYTRGPGQRTMPTPPHMTSPQQQQHLEAAASSSGVAGGAKAPSGAGAKKPRKPRRSNPSSTVTTAAPAAASASSAAAAGAAMQNRMGPAGSGGMPFDPQQPHHLGRSLDSQMQTMASSPYVGGPGGAAVGGGPQHRHHPAAAAYDSNVSRMAQMTEQLGSAEQHHPQPHQQMLHQQQQQQMRFAGDMPGPGGFPQQHQMHHQSSVPGMTAASSAHLHHQQQASSSNGLVLGPGSETPSAPGFPQPDAAAPSGLQQQQSLRLTIPKTKIGTPEQPGYASSQKNPESVYDFDPAKEEATKASVEARNKPLKVTIRMNAAASASGATAAAAEARKPAEPSTAATRRPPPQGKPYSYAFHQQQPPQQQQPPSHLHQHFQERAVESSGTDSAPASVEDISGGAIEDHQHQLQPQQPQQQLPQNHDESSWSTKQQLRKKLEKGRKAEASGPLSLPAGHGPASGQIANNGRSASAAAAAFPSGLQAVGVGGPAGGLYNGPPMAKKSRLAVPQADRQPQAKKSKKHRRQDASAESSRLSTPNSSAGASPATPADASSAASAPSTSRPNPALKGFKIPRKNTASEDSASSAAAGGLQQQQPQPQPLPPRFPQAGFAPGGGIRQPLYQHHHQQQQQRLPPPGSAYAAATAAAARQLPMHHPQHPQHHHPHLPQQQHRPMEANLFDQFRHPQQQQQQQQRQFITDAAVQHSKDTPDSPTEGPASPSPGGGGGGGGSGAGGGGGVGSQGSTVSIIPHN